MLILLVDVKCYFLKTELLDFLIHIMIWPLSRGVKIICNSNTIYFGNIYTCILYNIIIITVAIPHEKYSLVKGNKKL